MLVIYVLCRRKQNTKEMKKFFTAIMLLAGASMIAACVKSLVPDDNVNGNENENGKIISSR